MNVEVMAVDCQEERVQAVAPYAAKVLVGDASNAEFLRSLGVRNFDACIVAIGDNFLGSLETTFALDELGAANIVSRATSGRQEKFLYRNGATAVVFPERQLGNWTAIRYSSDNISNYIELPDGYSIIEVKVPRGWDGMKIGELDVRKRYNINILGVKNHKMDMNITKDTTLVYGQTMLVLGLYDYIQKLFSL